MRDMTEKAASSDPVEESIGYMLRRAQANARAAFDAALVDYDITAPQFAILNELHFNPGQSSADLSRRSTLTAQAVNLTVRYLEARKLLERSPHPVHGRILQTTLTPPGRALLKECQRRVRAVEVQMLKGLNEKERLVVVSWLLRTANSTELSGAHAVTERSKRSKPAGRPA
jgi:DNA-binding MarR family transcriptional regulator